MDELTRKRLLDDGWPVESIECFEKFRRPVAFFYPYLDKDQPRIVITPKGQGRLCNAYGSQVFVRLEGSNGMDAFPVKDVRPLGVRKREGA